MKDFAFVYGTLKQNYGANHKLSTSSFVGAAVTDENFVVISGGFPLAFLSSEGHPLRGELYEIDVEEVQPVLDAYEGYPHFYTRDKIMVRVLDEATGLHKVFAWMYHIPADQLPHYQREFMKPGDDGVLEWHRT